MKKYKLAVAGAGVILFVFFIWGCFWTAKTASYKLFYEDMVQGTVVEMVAPSALRIKGGKN